MRRTSEPAEPCWTWNRAQSIGIAPAHHQPLAKPVSSLRTGSFLDFWKMLSSTTMTCSSSPPRPRPPLLKIGALRPQWPQMYPPNFQRLKLVPSTTRSRHPPPALYRVPGQLTEPSRRQSSCFLQCSPSPCTLPGHSLGHIRVHEPPCQQKVTPLDPPFCGTQLAEICGVKGRGTSSFRGPTSLRAI